MKKIIIFDFNRTIYDPDAGELVPGVRFVLRTLLRRGFVLYLISRAGESRKRLMGELNVKKYFRRVVIAPEKRKRDFDRLAGSKSVNKEESFVVGDRVRKEIAIGNSLGLKTIWVRSGRFARETSRKKIERPDYTVKSLRDVLLIIH